jgi:hypothetical protein
VAIDADARARLEKRMEDRKDELGLSWRQVAERAGITYEGLRGARKGPSEIPSLTRRKIERALKWPDREIDRILEPDAATIPREWTPDELEQLRRWTLDELIEEGRRKIKTHGERHATEWLKDAAAKKAEMMSPEDSSL